MQKIKLVLKKEINYRKPRFCLHHVAVQLSNLFLQDLEKLRGFQSVKNSLNRALEIFNIIVVLKK